MQLHCKKKNKVQSNGPDHSQLHQLSGVQHTGLSSLWDIQRGCETCGTPWCENTATTFEVTRLCSPDVVTTTGLYSSRSGRLELLGGLPTGSPNAVGNADPSSCDSSVHRSFHVRNQPRSSDFCAKSKQTEQTLAFNVLR